MSTKKKNNPYKKYCCVQGCTNKTSKDLTFYNIPKDMDRRQAWLKAIDREDLLDIKKNRTKYNYVCSVHFQETDFITTICKRLINDALPTKCLPHQSESSSKTESISEGRSTRSSKKHNVSVFTYSHAQAQTETQPRNKSFDVKKEIATDKPNIVFMNIEPEIAKPNVNVNKTSTLTPLPRIDVFVTKTRTSQIQTEEVRDSNAASISTQTDTNKTSAPTTSSAQSPLKRKVKTEIEFVECKRQRSDEDLKIHDDLESNNASVFLDPDDEVTQRIRKLLEWQNEIKNTNHALYKVFALNLHYASPYAYRYLQTVFKLPSKSELNKFAFKIPPKLDDRVLYSLFLKIKSLPTGAKYCTISVDEMVLKRNLYYDIRKDEVIGFHNINGIISPEIAKNAYVIMLQGIYYKWKQPLAYAFLGGTVHYAALDSWMRKVILKLYGVGLEVKAIISDQELFFDKYAKLIKNVTVDDPYFFVDNYKVFYIFDVPNLLKSLRDNLLSSDFHFNDDKISWDYIKALNEQQKERKYTLTPKITDAHIEPNNDQRTSLKYAAEVFSHSVHAALETYIEFGQITEEARGTAKFIKIMDDLFDVMNSAKMKCLKKLQSAFTMSTEQEAILNEAIQIFKTIKSTSRETGQDNTSQIKTFYNFQITIKSLLQLFEDLKSEGFDYLLTRHLTRDNLESFFASIKKQCDARSEPTPIQFVRAFSKSFYKHMLKSNPTDCEVDINEILQIAEAIANNVSENPPDVDKRSLVSLGGGEVDHRMRLPKTNTLQYVAGFLLFKCYKKHPNCKEFYRAFDCVVNLNKPDFTSYKAYTKQNLFYKNLMMGPSLEMVDYVQRLDATFTRNFEHHLRERPGSEIYKWLQKTELPSFPCRCFPVDYLLKLFVRLRIYTILRFNIRNFRSDNKSNKQYLKVKKL